MAIRARSTLVPATGLAIVSLLPGCRSSPTAPAPAITLPSSMTLRASAAAVVDGLSIRCRITFAAMLDPAHNGQRGTMGGEIERTVLSPDGSGVAFFGDAYYPDLRITIAGDGRARLESYRNGQPDRPTGESRFWDALNSLDGVYDGTTRSISGRWTCRPLDGRGDTTGDVTGTWTLQP
jgi:hypothetical protein